MARRKRFNPKTFLSTEGAGRKLVCCRKGEVIFTEGEASDAVFVILAGSVLLSARPRGGRETPLDIAGHGDLIGKDSLAGKPVRTVTARAVADCRLLSIEGRALKLALSEEAALANAITVYLLARICRYQQYLLDQRCNSSEKRLAHVLLQMGGFEGDRGRETTILKINQGVLADMVGTTRSRVSFFLNNFKKSGHIDYGPGSKEMKVRQTLLSFYAQ